MIHIEIPSNKLEDFCRKHAIQRLAFFGSVLRDDFGPDSDVDILVEFMLDAKVGLFDISAMEIELTEILGHKTDLRTPAELSPHFRDNILSSAETHYVH